MKQQQTTTRQASLNSCRTRRRWIAETVALLLMCSTSISGFTVGGRKYVPLTRKHSTAKSSSDRQHSVEEVNPQPNRKFPWKKKTHNTSEDDKELREDQAVDEYLEFLDRRYRRLHDDELKKSSEQVKPSFSAWSWLHQEPSKTETVVAQQTQADALYVLGVAGLASKKLLQKHQIHFEKINHRSPKKQEETPTDFIDAVTGESPTTASRWSQKKQLLMSRLAKFVAELSNKRSSLLLFQKRQLSILARSTLIGFLQAPKEIARKAWNHGGGKRNVMFTASLVVAFTFVIIQPVLKTAAREGLNMTIG